MVHRGGAYGDYMVHSRGAYGDYMVHMIMEIKGKYDQIRVIHATLGQI